MCKRLRELGFFAALTRFFPDRERIGGAPGVDLSSISSGRPWAFGAMVRTAGFEPALPNGKRILSPQRLPFRHVRLSSHGDGRAGQGLFRGDFFEV